MPPPYLDFADKKSPARFVPKANTIARMAENLRAAYTAPCRLSPLIFMTDPRVKDIWPIIKSLPCGAAIIYRHFGAKDKATVAARLRHYTFEKGQQLLIGNDPALAIACGADGIHFSRRAQAPDIALWRSRLPKAVLTQAAQKTGPLSYAAVSLDAVFVSPVFESDSPSARTPMGPEALAKICASASCPIIALGGINAQTAPRLLGTGAAGLAGVSGFM